MRVYYPPTAAGVAVTAITPRLMGLTPTSQEIVIMTTDSPSSPMALFRYGVISPLLAPDHATALKDKITQLAQQTWTFPDGRQRAIAWGTIETWYYDFRKAGLAGLIDQPRKDLGTHPALPATLANAIDELLSHHPPLRASQIIAILRTKNRLAAPPPSDSTIYRYVREHRQAIPPPPQERRSFSAPHAGSLWQADIMYGPAVPSKGADGKYRQRPTYLIALIDDYSRLLCHGQFYADQSLPSWIDAFKKACQKRGIPQALYCDNGQVFRALQVQRIAATIGCALLHTQVRDAQAKGKIERFFRTVQDRFLTILMDQQPPASLEQLNQCFGHWMEAEYNQQNHSAINTTPLQKWLTSSHQVRLLPLDDRRDQFFFLEETRKVRQDGTFVLHHHRYETDWTLAGQTITIRYDAAAPTAIYVSCQRRDYGKANRLDVHANHRLPRQKKGTNP